MSISASMVKELRERTGAGMMECKNALVETAGDMDAAAEALRTCRCRRRLTKRQVVWRPMAEWLFRRTAIKPLSQK